MSILSQQNCFIKGTPYLSSKTLLPHITTRITCAATSTITKARPPSLTIKPSSTLPTITKVTTTPKAPRPDDPDLKSTWAHRAWLTCGCTTILISLGKCIPIVIESHNVVEPILASLAGYILADLGSGVYHWGIDNYGDGTTPVFGAQIEAFQGHHKWPWTITKRQFANNLHSLARVITFIVLPIDLIINESTLLAFVGSISGCIMFSQQFHAWAHSTKSKLPKVVVALQDMGVLVSRSQHSDHHHPPYNSNYCIVSGLWNDFLDENRIFEALEMVIFFQLGIKPRSWCEPNLEWIEESSKVVGQ